MRRLSDEPWDDDEPDHLDLYEVLQRIETREAFQDEFFYNEDETTNEAN